MSILITCSGCRKQLKVPDTARGKTLRCPSCQKTFKIPVEEPPPPAPIPEVLEAEPPERTEEPRTSRRRKPPAPPKPRTDDGWDYAESLDIDLEEDHRESVGDAKEADQALAEWKEDFPEVPSAYQPSGALPAAAVVWMGLGSLLGVPGGLLAGGVVALITGVVFGLVAGLQLLLMGFCGVVVCILPIVCLIIAAVGYFLTFVVHGYITAACTTYMGRLGKNRNTTAAAVVSILAAVVGLIIVGVGVVVLEADAIAVTVWKVAWPADDFDWDKVADQAKNDEKGRQTATWIVWALLVIGGFISVVAAGVGGAQMVADAKFCEDCEQYMDEKEMIGLRLGGLRALTKAMGERNVPVCVSLMEAPSGPHAKTKLFWCAGCNKGFMELTAHFKAKWDEKDETKDKTENWLVGSIALSDAEVALFEPFGTKSS